MQIPRYYPEQGDHHKMMNIIYGMEARAHMKNAYAETLSSLSLETPKGMNREDMRLLSLAQGPGVRSR